MFKHFPTKDALMKELAVRGFAGLAEVIRSGFKPTFQPATIASVFADYQHWAQENSSLYLLMFSFPLLARETALKAAAQKVRELLSAVVNVQPGLARETTGTQLWARWHGQVSFQLNGFSDGAPC